MSQFESWKRGKEDNPRPANAGGGGYAQQIEKIGPLSTSQNRACSAFGAVALSAKIQTETLPQIESQMNRLERREAMDDYEADMERDRQRRDHDLMHNDDVDECEWCDAENSKES